MNRRLAHLPSLPYMLGRADMGGIPSIAFAPCFLLLSAPPPHTHTKKGTTRKKGFGGNLNCGGIEGEGGLLRKFEPDRLPCLNAWCRREGGV